MKKLLLTTAAGLIMALPVIADAQTTSAEQPAATTSSATTTTQAPKAQVAKKAAPEVTAAEVTGQTVLGPKNKAVGTVTKALTDKAGKVTKLVIALKDYPNVADKTVAVPLKHVKIVKAKDGKISAVRLLEKAARLSKMPAYKA